MSHIKSNTHYQHQDGGLYFVDFEHIVTSSVDKSEWVVYRHTYPFEHKVWIRPVAEWTPERFRELTIEEVTEIMMANRDRLKFQQQIADHRAARRAQEQAACAQCANTGIVIDTTAQNWPCYACDRAPT